MALLKRQDVSFEIFDDQSPTLWGSYVGNWTRYPLQGATNNTITATPSIGASLSFRFQGSQAWLYGGLVNGSTNATGAIVTYPVAAYKVDDVSTGSQQPWFDTNGAVVYFQTPKLPDGLHEIEVLVTTANETNQFIIDYFLVTPTAGGSTSGVATSRIVPTSTSTSSSLPIVTTTAAPVGAIVGGVVGGIAGIAILVIGLWYFLRKRTGGGGQAYYFDKPSPADILASEDNVEPFNATATTPARSSTRFSGGPQYAYSEGSSNQPLNPGVRQSTVSSILSQPQNTQSGPSEGGMTYVSGNSAQPATGKAALISQQYRNVQPPVQHEDSGTRFNETVEEEAGPSQLPTEVPPTYTPH